MVFLRMPLNSRPYGGTESPQSGAVLKNSSDIANYNSEFATLQVQLYQMSQTTFNGVSLFGAGTSAVFGGTTSQGVTVSIFTSATGESGSKVSINKSMLLSALTVTPATPSTSQAWSSGSTASKATFAATSISTAIALGDRFRWSIHTSAPKPCLPKSGKRRIRISSAVRPGVRRSAAHEP